MLGFEITEQPPSRVVVDEIFTCAFHCPYTSRSFSDILKSFTPDNSFATAKLVDLPTLEDIDDVTYILGNFKAHFSDNVADRILRFQIGIRIPGSYKLLLSIHAKSSDFDTNIHYPVISDLWTDEIYVCVPMPIINILFLEESCQGFEPSDSRAGQRTVSAAHYRGSAAATSYRFSPHKNIGKFSWRGWA